MNWAAWAAVGTFAAVVVAMFGPAIQRWMVHKKSRALFMAAYMHDLVDAAACLRKIDQITPLGMDSGLSRSTEAKLLVDPDARVSHAETVRARLGPFSMREVDLTKWPAVDLHSATAIVVAIETTKAVVTGTSVLATIDPAKLPGTFKVLRAGTDAALAALALAEEICGESVGWLMDDYQKKAQGSRRGGVASAQH